MKDKSETVNPADGKPMLYKVLDYKQLKKI